MDTDGLKIWKLNDETAFKKELKIFHVYILAFVFQTPRNNLTVTRKTLSDI